MKMRTVIITGLIILATPNLPIINKYVAHKLDEGYFRYANLDGSFTMTQGFSFKSPGFSAFGFEHFVMETAPAAENRKLYRLYIINPLCFWRWHNYLRHGIHFDYKDWSIIEENRRQKRVGDTGWQSF